MTETLEEIKKERIKELDDWAKEKPTKHNPNCPQAIQYTHNCKGIHLYNICAEYPQQFCSNCFRHWSNCGSPCPKIQPINLYPHPNKN